MRTVATLARMLVLVAVLGATAWGGSTYYVATTGNDTTGTGTEALPWKTIKHGVDQLYAGDTLIIREGEYRETYINNFRSGSSGSPITVKGFPGEKVLLNTMTDASDTDDWELVAGTANVYRYKNATTTTYRNVSQAGKPLQLMVLYSDFAGAATDLTAEGQWSRNQASGELWVWAKGGGNPGNYDVGVTNCYTGIRVYNNIHYINIENITVEGGYYPIYIEGDYCNIKDSTFRNCFGDGIKVGGCDARTSVWNSINGTITNCDVYHFGESGIDITGGDYWTVKDTTVHDSVNNRYPTTNGGCKVNGIMLKNENIGTVIDGCRLYNLDTAFGAITLGGTSSYDEVSSAKDLVVKNNIIHDVQGPYIITFTGAEDCQFINNILYSNTVDDAQPYALVQMRYGISKNSVYLHSSGNTFANNIMYNNSFTGATEYNYREYTSGSDDDLTLDNNVVDGTRDSYFDGAAITHANMVTNKGYDANSQTTAPTFVSWSDELIRLGSSSVGVDDGMVLSDVGVDYNDIDRFLGDAFDIGPFENGINSTRTVYSDGTDTDHWVIPTDYDLTSDNDDVLVFAEEGTCWLFDDGDNSWDNDKQFVLTFKAKASARHAFHIRFYTKNGAWKSVKWYSWYTTTDFTNDSLPRFPLGTGSASTEDGEWHTYTFDVEACLKQALPNEDIDYIERFYVSNNDSSEVLYVDDIELHSTIQSAATPEGLIGEWKLNEAYGSHVEDTSGQGRHGELKNMEVTDPRESTWVIGEKNKALRFGAGTGHEYVEIPNLPTAGLFDDGMTIALRTKFDNLTDTYAGLVVGLTGYSSAYSRIFQQGNRIQFQIRMGGDLITVNSNTALWEAKEWVHLAVVVNMADKKITVYVNGEEETLNGVQTFTQSSIDTGTAVMRIGAGHIDTHQFNGCIDDVKLYNRPLKADEIAKIAE
jgi:Concanavalin A-like lectin/glucanases superfamily/Right handed beta helix region